MLLDVEALGLSVPDLSRAVVDQKVAATAMTTWSERVSPRYIRFAYSNEPVERLSQLRKRLQAAMDQLS